MFFVVNFGVDLDSQFGNGMLLQDHVFIVVSCNKLSWSPLKAVLCAGQDV